MPRSCFIHWTRFRSGSAIWKGSGGIHRRLGPRTRDRPRDKNHGSLSRNRDANEGGTRTEGGLPSIFFRPRRGYSTRDQGAVSDRSPLAWDRRHDLDHLPSVGTSRGRLPDRYPVSTPGRGEFSHSWLGRKLAPRRNILV